MNISAIDKVTATTTDGTLPMRLIQTPSTSSTARLAVLAFPIFLSAVASAGLALNAAINARATAEILLARPASAFLLVISLTLLAVLATYPAIRLAQRIGRRREITITSASVDIHDKTLRGWRASREPLANYQGIGKRIRTTLSAAHQEILLVHPDPRRSILLSLQQANDADTASELSHLLSKPLIDLAQTRPANAQSGAMPAGQPAAA
ncbi:MAG: hypothetical protein RLZ98_626 [Pseudomonadota bacterium]|jgi:hypothetical protein